jgi:DNA mismatch endonuclease, patch repair protein
MRRSDAPPQATSPAVRRRMQATRQGDTPAEVALRSALHRLGLRFRLHRNIEGVSRVRPDIVFVSARVAVYVDGCFWHSCPEHGSAPKANREWWADKLSGNVERDRRHEAALREAGWEVIRIWEHEDSLHAARRVFEAVAEGTGSSASLLLG